MATESKTIEWMCTHCGRKELKKSTIGRPMPGRCPRKTDGKPHTWVKNRTL